MQREKERIALGVEMIADRAPQGRPHHLRRRGHERPPRRARVGGDAADLRHAIRRSCRPSWPAAAAPPSRAKEGVEDNYEEGARAITRLRPTKQGRRHRRVRERHDAVRARRADARAQEPAPKIIFVTCDPGTELQTFVDLTIAPAVGPEVIAGSTRLKAGTATKMVLNMLTTTAMVRIGKTYGNLMVDVQTGSEKLKDRARRIVNIVTGLELRRGRQAADARALERQGRDRDAEDRPAPT